MSKEQRAKPDPWTNVVRHAPEDYLSGEQFRQLKSDLKNTWYELGWLHLRMTNDADLSTAPPLTRDEIRSRLVSVEQDIEHLVNVYLGEE